MLEEGHEIDSKARHFYNLFLRALAAPMQMKL